MLYLDQLLHIPTLIREWIRLSHSISILKYRITNQTLNLVLITLTQQIVSTRLILVPFHSRARTALLVSKKWINAMVSCAQRCWISDFMSFGVPKMIQINIYLTRIGIRTKLYLTRIRQPRPSMKRSKKRKSLPRVAMTKKQKNSSICNRLKITNIIASHYLIFLGPLKLLIRSLKFNRTQA